MRVITQHITKTFHNIMKHIVSWADATFKVLGPGAVNAIFSYTWEEIVTTKIIPLRAPGSGDVPSVSLFVEHIWRHVSTYVDDFNAQYAASYLESFLPYNSEEPDTNEDNAWEYMKRFYMPVPTKHRWYGKRFKIAFILDDGIILPAEDDVDSPQESTTSFTRFGRYGC